MKRNYLKKLFFALVLMASFLLPLSLSVKADTAFPTDQILYLTASVGETYDHVGISYHTASDDSYIVYGKNVNEGEILNPKTVTPTSTLWNYEKALTDDDSYGFSERYVCKATLTDLEPGTRYYYQAIDGNVKSPINSFKTLTNNGEKKTFFFLTDIQSSGSGFNNAQNLLNSMLATAEEEPNLLFMTGDQVDRAGQEQQWKDYNTYVTSLSTMLQATLPGNHEYYTTSGGGYVDADIYNAMTNNPLNGPADRLGSSYFFMYDNILFIMLDIVKTDYNVSLQQEWFRNVVKENPAKWIIVGSHPGMYSTGPYASDSSIVRRNWLSVFEECQVDIAFNGHEHIYARKNIRYGGIASSVTSGPKDEALGVTYLCGSAAGLKLYTSDTSTLADYDYVDYYMNNNGCAVYVDGDELRVDRIMANGQISDTFTLYAKRPDEITPMTDKQILDSFNVEYDEDTTAVTINWDGNIYGNAKNINIKGGNLKGNGVDLPVVTSSLDSRTWKGYYNTYNYYFTVTITKNDGTTISKNLDLILNTKILDYNINYELDGGTLAEGTPTTFNGKNLPITLSEYIPTPTKPGYNFAGWKINDSKRVSDTLDELYEDITLTATWEVAPFKVNYELDGGKNSSANPDEFFADDLPKKLYSASKDGYKFLGWYEGDVLVEKLTEARDYNLVAKWQKTNCVITYVLDGGTNSAANPATFNPAYLPTKLFNATKEGYIFGGWQLNGQIVTEIPVGTVDDITLTAIWEQSIYNINYVLDGGENDSSNEATYNVNNLPVRLEEATKDGYKFLGWKLNDEIIEQIPAGTKGDITLTAVWEKSTFNITYNLDGGTNNSANPDTYDTQDLPLDLKAPTKDGHTFTGWELNGKIIDEIDEDTTGDIELTATWEAAKKKGCKKKSAVELIFAISMFAGAVLLLKKRQH